MRIGSCCFKDKEIRNFIESVTSEVVKCDVSGNTCPVIEIEELADFFEAVLSLFEPDDKGTSISSLFVNLGIFENVQFSKKILNELFQKSGKKIKPNSKMSFIPQIKRCSTEWDKLKTEVREQKRFFADLTSFKWEAYLKPDETINKDAVFYRSRVLPESRTRLKPSDMGCPPKEQATAGRANPFGIPYLYLSSPMETTYYEVRSLFKDILYVGKFIIQEDLKVVNFTNDISLFYAYSTSSSSSLVDVCKKRMIIELISHDMSKPLRRYDKEIEYVPTQLICEFCKHKGADGIIFRSSLYDKGVNLVVFDEKKATCNSVNKKEITAVTITAN